MTFPDTKAKDMTELVMSHIKKKANDLTTGQYNRSYETVYKVMCLIFFNTDNYPLNDDELFEGFENVVLKHDDV